jgi:hypothetical protein
MLLQALMKGNKGYSSCELALSCLFLFVKKAVKPPIAVSQLSFYQ